VPLDGRRPRHKGWAADREPSGAAPSVTVSFNLKPGMSLGDATQAIDKVTAEILAADPHHGVSGAGS